MRDRLKGYFSIGFVQVTGLALLLNLMIESFGRQSLLDGLEFLVTEPKVFLYNTLIISVTLVIALLFRRRIFAFVLISFIWLALGVANGVILSFRMTPFTVTDLSLLENGLSILPNYMSTWQIILMIFVVLVVLALFVFTFLFAPKREKKIPYLINLIVVLSLLGGVFGITNLGIHNRWLSTYFSNLGFAYEEYGVPYCFINTWLNRGIPVPNHYSEWLVVNIFNDGIPMGMEYANPYLPVTLTAGTELKRKPNILFVQLESFIDPTLMKDVTFSEDPIPNFHRLQETNSTGFLRVPAVGAGTANTEYEVLTGMRIMSFGPGEYPYKTIMTEITCESDAYLLKNLGYSAHAIHNHRGAFYGRNEVYKNLGFDTFTSLEYMNDVDVTPRNWAKDNLLTGEILAAMESTEGRDFVFTVSVQGHGEYPKDQMIPDEELDVRVTSGIENLEHLNAVEYYVQQMHEMDQFVGDLVDTISDFPEDTIVVFYGDHLPVLDLTEDDLVNGSIYETEYLMVANFDLVKIDEDLAAYQLSASVFERLGIQNGILNWYHQTRKNYGNYLDNLEILQYDMLYGENYIFGGTNPFQATDMKMGVRQIKVSKIFNFGESTYVIGENFTPYSRVAVKGDFEDTVFVSPSLLRVPDGVKSLDPEDFSISQVGKYNTVLSTLEDVE